VSRDKEESWGRQLDSDTVVGQAVAGAALESERVLGLTILTHPDVGRVGERAILPSLGSGATAQVSRIEPYFSAPGDDRRRPLADPYLSRSPIRLDLIPGGGGLRVDCSGTRTVVTLDGDPVRELELSDEELDAGVVIVLAGRHALLLHSTCMPPAQSEERFGLIGQSPAMARLHSEVLRVADLDVPVLLRGETGTGKELAARAIHRAGPRTSQPFVGVNMGAIPPSLAAAELFGAERGAFTGAERRRVGHFEHCDGGTLFLDEVGEMPGEVQVLLLRALELKEIQAVGSERPRKVDVRVIAASDSDLESAASAGKFRAPLLHRLSGYEIELPPLRSRREDVGRLLVHFLREELRTVSEEHKMDDPGPQGEPWLAADLVARLAVHDWPGNVRQLRNVARQMVIGSRGRDRIHLTPQLLRLLDTSGIEDAEAAREAAAGDRPARAGRSRYRDPGTVTDAELLEALRDNHWQIKDAAAVLGVSRTSLYALIDRSQQVRKGADLDREEIEEAQRRCGGSLDAMVNRLEVSKKALKMRMKELGLR
jgi:two-component system nitrogen regulation response regulator GlnG